MDDVIEEDCLDDTIRLFDFEESGACYSELKNIASIDDSGFVIDVSKEEEQIFQEILSSERYTSLLPVTYFDNARNVELLNTCRPLSIKIVDYRKFPNYCDRKTVGKKSNNVRKDESLDFKELNGIKVLSYHETDTYKEILPKSTLENKEKNIKRHIDKSFSGKNLIEREKTPIKYNEMQVNEGLVNPIEIASRNIKIETFNNYYDIYSNKNYETVPQREKSLMKSPTSIQKDDASHKPHKVDLKEVNRNVQSSIIDKQIDDAIEEQLAKLTSKRIRKIEANKEINETKSENQLTTNINSSDDKKLVSYNDVDYDEQIKKLKISNFTTNGLCNRSRNVNYTNNEEQRKVNTVENISKSCSSILPVNKLKSINQQMINMDFNNDENRREDNKRITKNKKDYYEKSEISNSQTNNLIETEQKKDNTQENINKSFSPHSPCRILQNKKVITNTSLTSIHLSKQPSKDCKNKLYFGTNEIPHYHSKMVNNQVNNICVEPFSPNKKQAQRATYIAYTLHLKNFEGGKRSVSDNNNSHNLSKSTCICNNATMTNNLLSDGCAVPPCVNNSLRQNSGLFNIEGEQEMTKSIENDCRNLLSPQKQKKSCNTGGDKTPSLLNQEPLLNNKGMEIFPIQSVISNRSQNHRQPLAIPPVNCNRHNTNVKAIHNNTGEDTHILPSETMLTQPMVNSSMVSLPVKSSQVQSTSLNNNTNGRFANPPNANINVRNLIYVPKTNAETLIKKNATERNTKDIAEKHPHLVQALESSPIAVHTERYKKTELKKLNNTSKEHQMSEERVESNRSIRAVNKLNNTSIGYSPPILPIPTYEKAFEVLSKIKYYYFEGDKMYVNSESNISGNIDAQNLPQKPILKKFDKRKIQDEDEKVPRKISVSEYKRRSHNTVNNSMVDIE